MKIFLIEDDGYKKAKIIDCLSEKYGNIELLLAESVTSAVRLIEELDNEHIVLLDMSLPTYDLDITSGGRPQGFGGVEILRNMDFYEKSNRVIVITQYESIRLGNRVLDFNELKNELEKEFIDLFHTLINFNVISDDWKIKLINSIGEIVDNENINSRR